MTVCVFTSSYLFRFNNQKNFRLMLPVILQSKLRNELNSGSKQEGVIGKKNCCSLTNFQEHLIAFYCPNQI